MATSKARTVQEYLKELAPDRRQTIATVRKMILEHLPAGYQETMNWGLISYEIPRKTYPDTYNGQPLNFAGLASQKNYCALYLSAACQCQGDYALQLKKAFAATGSKLDMGKTCIRFKKASDLPLAEIGKIIASIPPAQFIKSHESARQKSSRVAHPPGDK